MVTPQVLIVGCGDLGTEVAHQLLAQDLSPIGLRRSLNPQATFPCLAGDVINPASLSVIQDLNPDYLIYCVAASNQTDENYRQHYVEGLRHVISALSQATHLKHVFFVSSTRMYGQRTDALLDEESLPQDYDFGGKRLLEAEELLKSAGKAWTYTALRLTGIYGPGRTRMLDLAAKQADWPASNVWTNRIHRDDAARCLAYLIHLHQAGKSIAPLYVVTDSCPVAQYEVLHWLAGKMGLDVAKTAPLVSGGKRMSNQKLRSTGFELRYPDYRSGYLSLLVSFARP